jgi:hypothetical protein
MLTQNGQFDLQILVNDQPLQEYPYQGERFVAGIMGSNFKLRISKTQLYRRAVAVISVDGLSIMDGKPAKADGSGYIIESGAGSFDIPGWRLNEQEVAAFFFASLPETYASQMGKPTNIGVIGAKFFYENVPEQPEAPESWGSTALPPSAPGVAPAGTPLPPSRTRSAPGVGTGFGSRQAHHIHTVQFERDYATMQTSVLRYDTAANLAARGIVLHEGRDHVMQADPFPGDAGCLPPPGWPGL